MARISIAFPKSKDDIEKVSSDPSVGGSLDMIFNTSDNTIKIFYDEVWHTLHTLTLPVRLLLETGDILLLEDGSEVLLES